MITETIPDLQALTPEQKLLLISELWESVTAEHIDIPVSKELLDNLEKQLADYQANPTQGAPWSEVKARIQASRK